MQICQYHNKKLCIFAVAPFAGAWIEIYFCINCHINLPSLPSRERGLKYFVREFFDCNFRRSLRGSVDWNSAISARSIPERRRSLRGSVDWNLQNRLYSPSCAVAPFAGAWIEIFRLMIPNIKQTRRSLRGSVDWNHTVISLKTLNRQSLPSRERGLKCSDKETKRLVELSLPSRERGLKYNVLSSLRRKGYVAPFAGAWIEILR